MTLKDALVLMVNQRLVNKEDALIISMGDKAAPNAQRTYRRTLRSRLWTRYPHLLRDDTSADGAPLLRRRVLRKGQPQQASYGM
jgi:hypothetical protein